MRKYFRESKIMGNKILEAIRTRDLRLKRDTKNSNGIMLIKKEGDSETYYPATTNKAWKLAENFLTNQHVSNKKKLLLTMAKKYKNTPNADFIRFFDDNGTLLIENLPFLGAGASCSNEAKLASAVQVAYFVRDFKTKELYFPKTSHEAWTLIKKLLPKELVKKATDATLHTP